MVTPAMSYASVVPTRPIADASISSLIRCRFLTQPGEDGKNVGGQLSSDLGNSRRAFVCSNCRHSASCVNKPIANSVTRDHANVLPMSNVQHGHAA